MCYDKVCEQARIKRGRGTQSSIFSAIAAESYDLGDGRRKGRFNCRKQLELRLIHAAEDLETYREDALTGGTAGCLGDRWLTALQVRKAKAHPRQEPLTGRSRCPIVV